MSVEKSSMRELVLSVGGHLRGDENRKSWLARVARLAGITPRAAKAAFYAELRDTEHKVIFKLRAAIQKQQAAAGNELADLRQRIARLEQALLAIDEDFHGPSAAAYREILRMGGRQDHAEVNGSDDEYSDSDSG